MTIHISFWIMTACALIANILYWRLSKKFDKAQAQIYALLKHILDNTFSKTQIALVEEGDEPSPHFIVYRQGRNKKHVVAVYGYNPNDPFDRDYKRIHAQEVADKLNEKP